MNHSYLLIGITFGRLIRLIIRNGGFSPIHFNRFLFLLQGSIWSSVFAFVEKVRFKKKLKRQSGITDPVIIVGNWRTGSTFLHQILALDKRFTTPVVVRVSVPDSFLVSEKYFRALMKKVVSNTRPMDNVKLGPDEPQEDEYALLKTVKYTTLQHLIFPTENKPFSETLMQLNEENSFSHYNVQKLKLFIEKLNFKDPGNILLKNPYHSFRISIFKKTFPEARFIHICRSPLKVIPSTVNMFNIIGRQNKLKNRWKPENLYTVTDLFNHVWMSVKNQLFQLSEKDYIEIKYEDFEQNPKQYIRKIYDHFGFDYSTDFDNQIDEFLNSVKNYKKNRFTLTGDEIKHIKESCSDFLNHYDYD